MLRRHPNINASPTSLKWAAELALKIASILALLGLALGSGCQRLSGGQAMRQYQLESDRLLNEFRAQKKRAEDLEARNVQLEQRLAESEKLLALSQNGYSSGRSSRNRNDSELLIGDATGARRTANSLSELGSSRSTGSKGLFGRNGLSDISTPTASQLTSGRNGDPITFGGPPRDLRGDRNRESQWRPVSGSQR